MIPYTELTTAVVPDADHRASYGSEALQFGELRLPSGDKPAPVVVLIHGGCWRAQYDIKHTGGAAAALAKDGFAVWSIEYRRVGDAGGGWPGTFDDVSRGVDHLRELARQFPRLDLTRVVLMGHSAGGQLALWAASRREGEQNGLYMSGHPPLAVSGVVSLAGITDLTAYGAAAGGCNTAVTPLMGGTAEQQPQRYAAVSPVARLPLKVPVRLVHGGGDTIVPLAQSNDFAARAKAAGDTAIVEVVEGAGHFDVVAPQSEAWMAVLRALHALTDK